MILVVSAIVIAAFVFGTAFGHGINPGKRLKLKAVEKDLSQANKELRNGYRDD
ncbi:hypothetical protein LJR098_002108 [Rhizobium sp. LjRoot98]|uniref:hypothetical protein n=1 Tax=unclassified Rhizobium TaxID=2613769 RepID=UPI000A83F9D6|nr:hypothetical protein [Rhizobium sp. Root1204]